MQPQPSTLLQPAIFRETALNWLKDLAPDEFEKLGVGGREMWVRRTELVARRRLAEYQKQGHQQPELDDLVRENLFPSDLKEGNLPPSVAVQQESEAGPPPHWAV